jgi:hypothetical protein
MVEAREQQVLDLRVAIVMRRVVHRACAIVAKRVGHIRNGPEL